MSRIVSKPVVVHECNLNWQAEPLPDDHPAYKDGFTYAYALSDEAWLPPGTVVECDCGKTWVAVRPYANVAINSWRPEGRIARWWRERRRQ